MLYTPFRMLSLLILSLGPLARRVQSLVTILSSELPTPRVSTSSMCPILGTQMTGFILTLMTW